ncbi:MAG TPA: amino acid adenylation domain-containing protein [Blastocatellia bacterium]|nr:amino acid adenylation domain-containing protein [Blastocatellia bacterium]
MELTQTINSEIVDLLIERGKKRGSKDAIVWQDHILSYDELEQRSNKVRDLLTSAGVANGSVVALLIEDTAELVASIIGVLKANCVFAPLDTKYPVNRLKAMVSTAEPQGFIVEKGFEEAAEQIAANNRSDCSIIVIKAGQAVHVRKIPHCASFSGEELKVSNDNPKDLGYIYFTSGSTGKPKGIAGSRRGLLHFIDWEIETCGVNENFRVSQLTPPSFDPFLRDIFLPLCAGATLSLPPDRETALDSEKLVRWIDSAQINLMHCTPSLFRSILNEPLSPDSFQSLKYILLAGEPIFPADLKKWYSVFGDRIQLVNLYGPTETTLAKFCYFIQPADQERRLIPVGKPIRGAKALVLDEKMEVCPPGVVGEIFIRTPYRSHGYYRQPELTRESFIRNPFNVNDPQDLIYRTGDIGRVTLNGDFELIGRLDNQVKIRGVRVELGEIEKLLRDHEDISEMAAKWGADIAARLLDQPVKGQPWRS